MNKFLCYLVFTLLSNFVMGQKRILSNELSYVVPKSTMNISLTERLKSVNSGKNSLIQSSRSGDLLKIDGISLLLHITPDSSSEDFLRILRNELNFHKTIGNRKYKIREITKQNNFSYLLYTYRSADSSSSDMHTLLYVVNDARNKTLKAVAEYDASETLKANTIIEDFIKSIKFE